VKGFKKGCLNLTNGGEVLVSKVPAGGGGGNPGHMERRSGVFAYMGKKKSPLLVLAMGTKDDIWGENRKRGWVMGRLFIKKAICEESFPIVLQIKIR